MLGCMVPRKICPPSDKSLKEALPQEGLIMRVASK